MEIERKWMVTGWPEGLPMEEEFAMRQGYISVRPTVRIREEALAGGKTDYVLCFKSEGGLAREEIERSIDKELFEELELSGELILIDLAVPRDIEPSVGKIQGVTLYDMDSFRIEEVPAELQENLEAAGAIVREQMDEFFQWLDGRDLIPRIQDIKDEAVNDLNLRIAKILKKTPMEEDDRQNLVHAVDTAAGKVVNKLIFGLRDSLNQEIFLECVAGLEKIYEE